jgi:hypothetical protein
MTLHSTAVPSGWSGRTPGEKWSRTVPHTDVEAEILAFLRSEQDGYYRGDFDALVDHWHHGPVRPALFRGRSRFRIHTVGTNFCPSSKKVSSISAKF